jgi:hypothetical protein
MQEGRQLAGINQGRAAPQAGLASPHRARARAPTHPAIQPEPARRAPSAPRLSQHRAGHVWPSHGSTPAALPRPSLAVLRLEEEAAHGVPPAVGLGPLLGLRFRLALRQAWRLALRAASVLGSFGRFWGGASQATPSVLQRPPAQAQHPPFSRTNTEQGRPLPLTPSPQPAPSAPPPPSRPPGSWRALPAARPAGTAAGGSTAARSGARRSRARRPCTPPFGGRGERAYLLKGACCRSGVCCQGLGWGFGLGFRQAWSSRPRLSQACFGAEWTSRTKGAAKNLARLENGPVSQRMPQQNHRTGQSASSRASPFMFVSIHSSVSLRVRGGGGEGVRERGGAWGFGWAGDGVGAGLRGRV